MSDDQYKRIQTDLKEAERWVIPFNLAVPTISHRGVSSSKIPFPFKVTKVGLVCPPDRLMQTLYYFLLGSSGGVQEAAVSEGSPVYNSLGISSYLRGDNCFYEMSINRRAIGAERYVKLHVYNGTLILQTYFGYVEIEQTGEDE